MAGELHILVGISGSGKTTFGENLIKSNPSWIYFSSDKLRAIYGRDESDQSVNNLVFNHLRESIKKELAENKIVLFDATNYNKKNRADFIKMARDSKAKIVAYCFNISLEEAQARNLQRERQVPAHIIERQFKNLAWPTDEVDEMFLISENGESLKVIGNN